MRSFQTTALLGLGPLCLCCLSPLSLRAQQVTPAPLQESVTVFGQAEPVTQGQATRVVESIPLSQQPPLVTEAAAALRTDSSVDVQMRGPMGVQSDISMRGGSFEQTLILLNGLRINDAETSHFNFDLPFPLAALAGMDVLHGSGSTLYGSDALSGAVNVRTLRPQTTLLLLRSGAGSYGITEEAAQFAAVTPRQSLMLTGARDASTGFLPDRDFRSESLGAEAWLHSRLGTTDLLAAGSDRRFGADQFYGNYPSAERTKGWFAAATQDLGRRTTLAAAYRRHTDVFTLVGQNPALYQNNHVDRSVQVVLRRADPLGKALHLATGLDTNEDQINSSSLGRHGRNRTAGYGELDLRTERLSLSAGLREEVIGGYGVVSAPGLSAALWLRSTLKVRASAGYGFRLPTFVDKYYSDPTTLPNPALKPESAWSYEGGLDWYPSARLALSATGYTSRQSNAIDYVRAPGATAYQAQNLSTLHLTGAEVALHTLLPGLGTHHAQFLNLSYTGSTGAQSVLGSLQSRYLSNYPTHNSSAEWVTGVRQLTTRLRLGVTQRPGSTAYAVLDLSAAREQGRLRPYLRMTNLANTGYQEIAGVRMQGRAFVGGLELALSRSAHATSVPSPVDSR